MYDNSMSIKETAFNFSGYIFLIIKSNVALPFDAISCKQTEGRANKKSWYE